MDNPQKITDSKFSFLIRHFPFISIITMNIIVNINSGISELVMLITCTALILNFIIAAYKKEITYFMIAITVLVSLSSVSILFKPYMGFLFLQNIIPSLYLALFAASFFPPLFNINPFTYEYSKKDYPPAVWKTKQFKVINLILNYFWALIFIVCFFTSYLEFSKDFRNQQIILNSIHIFLLIFVGVPLTKYLPGYLQKNYMNSSIRFKSVKDLFAAMPFGLNKERAKGVDAVIQFYLSGEEDETGFLTIKDQSCTYSSGEHKDPAMTVISESRVWLDIANKDLSGDKAFINRMYEVEGDASLLLKMEELFNNSENEISKRPESSVRSINDDFKYGTFKPNELKKVLVIDGGGRVEKFSKSTMMAKKFCEGIESSGGEVEYIHLRNLKINHCSGCYSCWTKKPGVCRHKDDMPELLIKSRNADLVVFVSPLFIFSVTSRLKTFLDRSIPNIKPYMLKKDGLTFHPTRFPEKRKGFIIFSAGGFPEVKGNFNGVSELFRCLSNHSEKDELIGEFYLPAAELLSQPVYSERRKKIEKICFEAGRQVIEEGIIDKNLMEEIQNPEITQDKFQSQADNFWEYLDGKMPYYKGVEQLLNYRSYK